MAYSPMFTALDVEQYRQDIYTCSLHAHVTISQVFQLSLYYRMTETFHAVVIILIVRSLYTVY